MTTTFSELYSPLYRKTLFFHCVESYPVIILNIFSTDTGTDEPQYLNKKIYFDLAIKKKKNFKVILMRY